MFKLIPKANPHILFSHVVVLGVLALIQGCNLFSGDIKCETSEDCPDDQVCDYYEEVCSDECTDNRDCDNGQRCGISGFPGEWWSESLDGVERLCADTDRCTSDCDKLCILEMACGDDDDLQDKSSNCEFLIGDDTCHDHSSTEDFGGNWNCEEFDFDENDCLCDDDDQCEDDFYCEYETEQCVADCENDTDCQEGEVCALRSAEPGDGLCVASCGDLQGTDEFQITFRDCDGRCLFNYYCENSATNIEYCVQSGGGRWGDGTCDSSIAQGLNFNCAEWGFDNGDCVGGVTPSDAGSNADAGAVIDAGTTPQDSGTTPQDGGTTPQDGGTTPQDGGSSPIMDAGAEADGGGGPVDAGPYSCGSDGYLGTLQNPNIVDLVVDSEAVYVLTESVSNVALEVLPTCGSNASSLVRNLDDPVQAGMALNNEYLAIPIGGSTGTLGTFQIYQKEFLLNDSPIYQPADFNFYSGTDSRARGIVLGWQGQPDTAHYFDATNFIRTTGFTTSAEKSSVAMDFGNWLMAADGDRFFYIKDTGTLQVKEINAQAGEDPTLVNPLSSNDCNALADIRYASSKNGYIGVLCQTSTAMPPTWSLHHMDTNTVDVTESTYDAAYELVENPAEENARLSNFALASNGQIIFSLAGMENEAIYQMIFGGGPMNTQLLVNIPDGFAVVALRTLGPNKLIYVTRPKQGAPPQDVDNKVYQINLN